MGSHGISWELMGEGALRGKIGVLVTEWRVTFLDALHKRLQPTKPCPASKGPLFLAETEAVWTTVEQSP